MKNDMKNVQSTEIESEKLLYSDPFDKGYWMMWQLGQDDKGEYIYNARAAIEHFERKYKRFATQIAIGKKIDIDNIELIDISVPVGQMWIR